MSPFVKEVLNAVEPAVIQVVEKNSDALVAHMMKKLNELIPGQVDDVIGATVLPQLQAEAKKFLLAQVDKIDGEVG